MYQQLMLLRSSFKTRVPKRYQECLPRRDQFKNRVRSEKSSSNCFLPAFKFLLASLQIASCKPSNCFLMEVFSFIIYYYIWIIFENKYFPLTVGYSLSSFFFLTISHRVFRFQSIDIFFLAENEAFRADRLFSKPGNFQLKWLHWLSLA